MIVRRTCLGSGVAALLLLAAAPAGAATVSATTGGSGPFGVASGSVVYTAAPGEVNQVTMRLVAGTRGIVDVQEGGAALSVGPRCTLLSAGVAQCDTAADFTDAMVDLGDGNDSVTIDDPLYGNVVAGPGDDTVIGACQAVGQEGADHLVGCANTLPALGHRFMGGPGDDVIDGGPAADTLDGGGGRDVLNGGGGNDFIDDGDGRTGGNSPDSIDGGADMDTVSYTTRTGAVQVDLSRTDIAQGAAGDADRLQAVESVYGGSGNDILIGNDDANRLDGGRGRDILDGRGGADQLFGGAGTDTIRGADGGDYIVARDVYRDSVDCGGGADQLLSDRGDSVASGCESVTKDYRLVSFDRLGARSRRVSYRVRCLESDELPRTTAREFEPCTLNTALRFRVHGHITTVATGRCNLQGCTTLLIRRDAWHTLLAKRSMTAWVEFTRIPKPGSLVHLDRVTLKVHK